MLPEEKTTPVFELSNYNWLIYGQPKIGKSTFVSQFDDVLFVPTEPGLGALSVFKACEDSHITKWTEFIEICKEIEAASISKKLKFKILAIDTIDNLYQMCLDYVCAREKMAHPSDGSFGKGWSLVTNEFKGAILRLSKSIKIAFISHDGEAEMVIQKIKVMRKQPSIAGGAKGEFITGLVDIITYISNDPDDNSKRVAYFRGHDGLVAGDRTNKMLNVMPFSYEDIKEQFSLITKK